MRRIIGWLALAGLGCGEPVSEYYRGVSVDPATLQVTLTGSEGGSRDGAGWWYFRFRDARGRQGVGETLVGRDERVLACRDYLSLDPEFRLLYRSKQQEIWRGDFGLILASTTYYYGPDYAGQPTGFETVPNANQVCAERPVELDAPPQSPGRLDGVSVVLISATDSGFAIVTANYDGGGGLYAFGTGHVAGRSGVPPDSLRATGVVVSYRERVDSLAAQHGLPARLGTDTTFATAGIPDQLVSFHYDHNRLVRQNRITEGRTLPVRWLSFAETDPDRVLAPRDDARGFGARAP